jgi:hypothetical protein
MSAEAVQGAIPPLGAVNVVSVGVGFLNALPGKRGAVVLVSLSAIAGFLLATATANTSLAQGYDGRSWSTGLVGL